MSLLMENSGVNESNIHSRSAPVMPVVGNAHEKYEPPSLSMDEFGVIQDCSDSCEIVFGYPRRDLVSRHISSLFPVFSEADFTNEGRLGSMIIYLCRCGNSFEAQRRQGETFCTQLSLVHLIRDGIRTLRLILRPSGSMSVWE